MSDTITLGHDPKNAAQADVVFVFAGRESRKRYGLWLHSNGRARTLLLSVARFEIRRFAKLPLPGYVDLLALAAPIHPPARHFFVWFLKDETCVERIGLGRLGTLSEVRALRKWLSRHPDIKNLLLVSSRPHRFRIELCCRELLPVSVTYTFLSAPPFRENGDEVARTGAEDGIGYYLAEYAKAIVYWLVLLSGRFGKQDAM